jgi:hypothetical protein
MGMSLEVVDGRLWDGISSEKRELLRSFLRYLESEISKLSRPTSRFDFRNGSIGNFFLTGARLVRHCPEVNLVFRIPRIVDIPPFLNISITRNNNRPSHHKYQPQHSHRR